MLFTTLTGLLLILNWRNILKLLKIALKSIEIDPGYSKAYSRLGLAYYNQGNYSETLDKGFLRALQLNPDSKSIKESVKAAQRMLVESSIPANNLNSGSGHRQDSTAGQGGSASIPFVFDNSTPTEFLSTIRNVVSAATQNLHGRAIITETTMSTRVQEPVLQRTQLHKEDHLMQESHLLPSPS
ncbi:hypothetical protein HPP92_011965 [Vanilla planifolia]|uniref:Uncharacterized protein n=1 Tax=Vanilla planifolia TaxID=51239 RepID=A0A835R826_VANPL|nr:hypothetical protein HPP92_011965 [Vanilla planifolia]